MAEARYTLTCKCGNVIPSDTKMRWCLECGQKVFADAKAERNDKLNHYYTMGAIVAVVIFLAYLVYAALAPYG